MSEEVEILEQRYQEQDDEARRQRQAIEDLKDKLDEDIQAMFADRFAAIEKAKADLKNYNGYVSQTMEELGQARMREFLARLKPGMRVQWEKSNGWSGYSYVYGNVVQVRGDKVQINTGSSDFFGKAMGGKMHWVTPNKLRIMPEKKEDKV